MAVPDSACPDPKDVSALILGAGAGQRLGGVHKSFLEIDGVTLVERAVRLAAPFAAQTLVALPAEFVTRGRQLLADWDVEVIAGGETRQASLALLARRAQRAFVLEAEVARPFAKADHVTAVLAEARRHGAATGALSPPIRDSIAVASEDGRAVERVLPRARVVWTRTPSAYRREWLMAAIEQAGRTGQATTTTAALLVGAGFRVRLIEAAPENVKITFPEDLDLLNPSQAR